MNPYIRFLIVAIASTLLAWFATKYPSIRNRTRADLRTADLLACLVAACSTCAFIGIILIDSSRYVDSFLFYWIGPIVIGAVFGVIACKEVFLSSDD
jgi:hypothetical protein